MATKARIATELARMALVYRQPLSETELAALTNTWADLFDDVPDPELVDACKAHLRESSFFPCPADIFRALENLPHSRAEQPALFEAETDREEDRRRAAVSAAMCRLAMRDDRAKEFFSINDLDKKEALAREMLGDAYLRTSCSNNRDSAVALKDIFAQCGRVRQ